MQPRTYRRRMLAAAALSAAVAAHSSRSAPPAATSSPNSTLNVPAALDHVPVTVNIAADVSALSPFATGIEVSCKGWVVSGVNAAHAQTAFGLVANAYYRARNGNPLVLPSDVQEKISQSISRLTSYTTTPTVDGAYYYHSYATVSEPLLNHAYRGTLNVTFNVAHEELIDAATHATVAKPSLAVFCALVIKSNVATGTGAAIEQLALYGPGNQLADASNFYRVAPDSGDLYLYQVLPIPGF